MVLEKSPGGPLNSIFEPSLLMHGRLKIRSRCPFVCLWLDKNYWTEVTGQKFISQESFELGVPNLVWWWTLMLSRSHINVKITGQGQCHHVKNVILCICISVLEMWLVGKVSRFKVKGHMGQGQRSNWPGIPNKGSGAHINFKLIQVLNVLSMPTSKLQGSNFQIVC